jgi:hypothetical protein
VIGGTSGMTVFQQEVLYFCFSQPLVGGSSSAPNAGGYWHLTGSNSLDPSVSIHFREGDYWGPFSIAEQVALIENEDLLAHGKLLEVQI